MILMNATYNIQKKYMAQAMSYLGYRYYKYNTENGVIYSFERTPEFMNALNELVNLKKNYGNKYEG